MRKKEEAASLLPSGFADQLPPESEIEASALRELMDVFAGFGYARVKPPLVEFEESLLARGPGAALAAGTFRLMDPDSHRMMGVRSDITPQIARIAGARLVNEKRPLRLMYANDVLRTHAGGQRTERQFCQAGCELIGAESTEYDTEICILALLGLKKIGAGALTIDLSAPRLLDSLFTSFKTSAEDREMIHQAVKRRDRKTLESAGKKITHILEKLIICSGNWRKACPSLEKIKLPKAAQKQLEQLRTLASSLAEAVEDLALEGISITIDPLENQGFEYHKGPAFTLFSPYFSGELGRGGRYDICFANTDSAESASGFTLYMDSVRKVLPERKAAKMVFVPIGESWNTLIKLQKEGWKTLRGDSKDKAAMTACGYIYWNGKIQKTKD